jgi:23S rRNA pseudouridine955/2504/2580 synthase
LVESLEQRILFEDDGVIVLDKPAGLAVHGGSGLAVNLIDAMRCLRPGPPTVELVHRLDRETSGCLLIAKHRRALGLLHQQLKLGLIHKHYLMLLAGVWRDGTRSVRAPLARNRLGGGERETCIDSEGREAVTHFRLQTQFAQACLVEATIETGRTHQIRVHAAHTGHPVAGDNKYGNARFNRLMKTAGLKRLFLHASRLEFDRDGRLAVTAPLPQELQAVLQALGAS